MTPDELKEELVRDLELTDLYSLPTWLEEMVEKILLAGWVKDEPLET